MTRSDLGTMFALVCRQWFMAFAAPTRSVSVEASPDGIEIEVIRRCGYRAHAALLRAGMIAPRITSNGLPVDAPSLAMHQQFYKVLDAAWKWHENSPDFWRECECDMCQVHREVCALRELIESGLEKAEES